MTARWLPIAAAPFLLVRDQPLPPSPRDALQAVLAYEAAQPHERTPVCVLTSTDGMTFDQERQLLREERQFRPVRPRDIVLHQERLSAFEQRRFDWRVAPPSDSGHSAWPRLDPEQGELLSAAARSFATSEPAIAPPLDLSPIPAPLHSGISSDCPARLKLTAPIVTGDLLFVQTSYVCGGLCGVGLLYALRWEGNEWRIVAIAETWVS